MKKTLIALAAVAVAGAASAQVTLSGNIAFALQNTVKNSQNDVDMNNAAVKFAASEDLGGGMKISASTELGLDDARSATGYNRGTSVTLSGGFGELWVGSVLSGAAKMSAGESLEDDISDAMGGYSVWTGIDYTLPTFVPGVFATLEWTKGSVKGAPYLYVGYADGPLWVRLQDQSDAFGDAWDLRATYDAGVAKLGFRTTKSKAQELSVTAPVGAVTVGLHFGKGAAVTAAAVTAATTANATALAAATDANGDVDGSYKAAALPTLGYVGKATAVTASYSLSKRTAVKFSYATGDFQAGTAKETSGNNYRLALSHSF